MTASLFGDIGPYFAAELHAADAVADAPWQAMSELVDGDALSARIEATAAGLALGGGTVEARVAASVAHLGLAARVVAPVLAAAVLSEAVPVVDLRSTWWQPQLGGAFPLSLATTTPATTAATTATTVPVAGSTSRSTARVDAVVAVLDGPIADLGTAVETFGVSPHIVWGNVASGVHSAIQMIARARPAHADDAHRLLSELFGRDPLVSTATFDTGRFRRTSCCLIYRIAPEGTPRSVCGDCPLDAA